MRPVYGKHLKQILVTMGGLIVAEQLINAIWGAAQIPLAAAGNRCAARSSSATPPSRTTGCSRWSSALWCSPRMLLVLNRTRIGLLIRAGVENREMVEALGYRIRRLFVGVFVAGSALAGLGGVMWGFYQADAHGRHRREVMVLVFIVIIIGGLGSVGGCFVGALLVALVANYAGFLAPKLALVSNILLMVASCCGGRRACIRWRADDRTAPAQCTPFSTGICRATRRDPAARGGPARDPGRAGARALPVPRRAAAEHRRQDLRLHRAGRELRPAARLYRHRLLRPHHVLRHRRLRRGHRARTRWAPTWSSVGIGLAVGARAVRSCSRSSSACSRCACAPSSSR